ncbi:MAG: T9SS type A sorting domain-containing protein [Prevotellaceae bacterium]|jgi:hypothetical protein|nr:T9SS type A sorting domain-containing protein [Prevotellaceae bacterium]
MKRFLIFTVLFSLGISVFAQEYYYWYRGEKIPLELMPTRKFILLASPDDTLALKNRLTEQHIHVYPFEITPITHLKDKYIDKESDCWTVIEGENLPDFTFDESILYETPGFLLTEATINRETLPSHVIYVRLRQASDFTALQNLAAEKGVTIRGSSNITLWYILECSKESAGNTLQMANLFYETGLFEAAEPEFRTFGTFILDPIGNPTGIASLSAAASDVYIDTQNTDNIIVFSKNNYIDNLQIFGMDGRKVFESSWSGKSLVNVNMSNRKGIYVFKITLHSGDVICRKTVIK